MKTTIIENIKFIIHKKRAVNASMARDLGIRSSSLEQLLRGSDCKVSRLVAISHSLKHNFFADLARSFPEQYTVLNSEAASAQTSKDEEILRLKHRIEILEAQVEVLRR